MHWPKRAEYAGAVGGYPHISIKDPKLKGGRPKFGKDGFLVSFAGGFSIVFPLDMTSQTYALRCWTQEVDKAEFRYKEISTYLKQVSLPYFVDFEYVSNGILINGTKYPITRMEWAEGETLRNFVEQNLQDSQLLKMVVSEFQKMVACLHNHQIAHGDLQDGNILLKRNGTDINIKLIDYDSLFVPALKGQPDQIVGLKEYQHPKRMLGGGSANDKVDYFSELVIYLSFLSLVEKPDLWTQFGNENRVNSGLLFSKEDFENPNQSGIFQELENLSTDVQQLTTTLKDFCAKTSIDELEPLEAILPTAKHDEKYYTDRGFDQQKRNRYNEAISEFHKAIAINLNYEEAHYGLGLSYLHCNRYNEAINACEQAISINRNYKEAYLVLGHAHLKSGNNSKAITAANAALKIDPYYQPARQLLDVIKSATSRVSPPQPIGPKPKSHSTKPTSGTTKPQSVPSNPAIKVWRILTAASGLALVVCISVLIWQMDVKDEVFPPNTVSINQLDQEDTETRQKESEIQNVPSTVQIQEKEKNIASRKNDALPDQLKNGTFSTDTISKNVASLQKQLSEKKDENRKLHDQLTKQDTEIRQLRKEKTDTLSENLKSMLEGNNSRPISKDSTVQQLLKEKTEVLSENKRLQKQNENLVKQNENLQNENMTLLSQLNQVKQQNADPIERSPTDEELTELFKIIKPEPPKKIQDYRNRSVIVSAGSHNNQGYIDFNRSDFEDAVKQFERAIKLDSKFAVAHYNLGCTYLEMKEYPKAVNALNKAVALDLNFQEAYYNRGLAYVKMRTFKNARQSIEKTLSIDANNKPARKLLTAIENFSENQSVLNK